MFLLVQLNNTAQPGFQSLRAWFRSLPEEQRCILGIPVFCFVFFLLFCFVLFCPGLCFVLALYNQHMTDQSAKFYSTTFRTQGG